MPWFRVLIACEDGELLNDDVLCDSMEEAEEYGKGRYGEEGYFGCSRIDGYKAKPREVRL